ncbi:holo-ACP synthase [Bhargavaea ginsengi]|uniref:holo-ACP synthase n=1 Tax=Bhargavaea ginsengi TaxID=426757 RepID=UPI0020409DC8|nr:holo-ACP synthase [Bhargavaea ginsengi]MCM3087800.1 holo-ACP synthase [Bhargavaea ginsengi]
MITGIGLDIVEMDRIRQADGRSDRFRERILSEEELERYDQLGGTRRIEYLAGRFAAKEAFAKALGTGIGASCAFSDISVLSGEGGRPMLYFRGNPAPGFVSITHSREYAAAQVILTGFPAALSE